MEGLPSRLLADSAGLGWRAVDACSYADPPETEAFRTGPARRLLVVLVTAGRYRIESRHGNIWRSAAYRAGSVGATAPGNSSVLRWRSSGAVPMRSVHLRLDPSTVEQPVFPDALTVHDEFVTAGAWAMARALEGGAPALYADSVARALVAHLALRPRSEAAPATAALGRHEVARIDEYMRAHLAGDVSIDELAAVANVSKFHFIRVFAATTGLTPYRYLRRMRLRTGAELLRTTGLDVARIAGECGYRSAGQFAAAFRKEYGMTPSAMRRADRAIPGT